jgi:hypothetical protein
MIDCAEWAIKFGFARTSSVKLNFVTVFSDIEVLLSVSSVPMFFNKGFVMSDGTSTIAKRTIS